MKKSLIRYSVTAAVGLLLALAMTFLKQVYWLNDSEKIWQALCDCFFVPGILLFLFGVLVFCTNGGTFDMLGFGAKKFFGLFRREKTEENRESFYDYRVRKQKNRRSFGYLLIVGAVFLMVAVVFFLLYKL